MAAAGPSHDHGTGRRRQLPQIRCLARSVQRLSAMDDATTHLLLVEASAGEASRERAMLLSERRVATFDVTHVSSLEEALAHLHRAFVDVILLDVVALPLEVDSLAQVAGAGNGAPIIVLTSVETPGPGALEGGAHDYLDRADLTSNLLVRTIRHATERHRLIRQLEQSLLLAESADRAGSRFLANVSQELRTPMNRIVEMAVLLSESTLTPQQQAYVESFRSSSAHLLKLTEDLLDLSCLATGQLTLRREPFEIRSLVRQAVELLALRALSKGITLTCRLSEAMPAVLVGDPQRLQQILVNLVGNAVKFTTRGRITVEVTQTSQGVESGEASLHFAVADTGAGIPADQLELIFESFYQVDPSLERGHAGTGLGLALSRRLVGLMGGRLGVVSELGRGSTFGFGLHLPVRDGHAPRPRTRRRDPGTATFLEWGAALRAGTT
jgi:signal transduction histidine kinase